MDIANAKAASPEDKGGGGGGGGGGGVAQELRMLPIYTIA